MEWQNALLVLLLLLLLLPACIWTQLQLYEKWHASHPPILTYEEVRAAFQLTRKEGNEHGKGADATKRGARWVNRIVVVGCSGSGKSVLSRALSQHLHLPLVVLDDLFWLPQWRERSSLQLQRRVLAAINDVRYADDDDDDDDQYSSDEEVMEEEETTNTGNDGRDDCGRAKSDLTSLLPLLTYRQRGFVIDGNYFRKLNDTTLSRCQLIVHMHLPYFVTLRQIVSRTVSRYWRRQRVCNGNVETVRSTCCDASAVIPWMMKAHPGFLMKVNCEVQKENERRVADQQSEDEPIRVLRILNDADRRLFLQFVAALHSVATDCAGTTQIV